MAMADWLEKLRGRPVKATVGAPCLYDPQSARVRAG